MNVELFSSRVVPINVSNICTPIFLADFGFMLSILYGSFWTSKHIFRVNNAVPRRYSRLT